MKIVARAFLKFYLLDENDEVVVVSEDETVVLKVRDEILTAERIERTENNDLDEVCQMDTRSQFNRDGML